MVRALFILIASSVAFAAFRPVVDSIVHAPPDIILRIGVSLGAVALFAVATAATGKLIFIYFNGRFAPKAEEPGQPSVPELILVGLLWITLVGIFMGVAGLLHPVAYCAALFAPLLAIAVFARPSPSHGPAEGGASRHRGLVLAVYGGLVVFALYFCVHNVVDDMALKIDIDYGFQYYLLADAVLENQALRPTMWAGENKIHEYYYSIAMGLPFTVPDTAEGMALLGLGLQALIPALTYAALRRLVSPWGAVAGAVVFTTVFVAMTFAEHSDTIIKFNLRFLLLCYCVCFLYSVLAAKDGCPLDLTIATAAAGLAGGTTIVGLFGAAPWALLVAYAWRTRIFSRRACVVAAVAVCMLVLVPKAINYAVAGTPLDHTSTILLRLWPFDLFHPDPKYFSPLDAYFYTIWEISKTGQSSSFGLFEFAWQWIVKYSGWLLALSALIDWHRARAGESWRWVAVGFEVHAMAALAASSYLSYRHSIFFIPAFAWAAGNGIGFAAGRFAVRNRAADMPGRRRLAIWFAAGLAGIFVLMADWRTHGFLLRNPLAVVQEAVRVRTLVPVIRAGDAYLTSEDFRQVRALFRPDEPVMMIGLYRLSLPFLHRFAGFRPIYYTNVLNAVLYRNVPVDSQVAELKQRGIRYFLFETRDIPLPRPALLSPATGGRFLEIVRNRPLLPHFGTQPPAADEILLRLRGQALDAPDPEVSELLSRYRYKVDPAALKALRRTASAFPAPKDPKAPEGPR